MLCKICGTKETDNPDGICDDCKIQGLGGREGMVVGATIGFYNLKMLISVTWKKKIYIIWDF